MEILLRMARLENKMQGLIIGGTDYSAQSLNDIKKDIIKWKECLKKLKSFLEIEMNILEKDSFWENNVPFNFRIYVGSLPKVISTFISDFNLILEDLNNDVDVLLLLFLHI